MQIFNLRKLWVSSSLFQIILLLMFWIVGAMLGYELFLQSKQTYILLARSYATGCAPFVGKLILLVMPFAVLLYAIIKKIHWPVHLLCFSKAVLFSLNTFSIYAAFGASGWLAICLQLLSCVFVAVIVLYLSVFRFAKMYSQWHRVFVNSFFVALIVSLIDCIVIFPFAQTVLNF